jgi:cell division protein FtsB
MMGTFFRFFIPKFLVAVSIGLAFWIGSVTFKEMDRGKRIQEEIAGLRAEAQKTEKENSVLQEKIRYFQTDAFQEQEARNKLNYQGQDERTVVIKPIVPDDTDKEQDKAPIVPKTHNFLPNYEKWWTQFFEA